MSADSRPADARSALRAFQREVTQRAGALEEEFLGRGRPLGQSRVLWEIGADGEDLRDLRLRLGLDSGYLSRLLRALVRDGLARIDTSSADQRVRTAHLTDAGRAERGEMERRAESHAAAILAPLSARQQARLACATTEVCRLLRVSATSLQPIDPADPALRESLGRYAAELGERFASGFDLSRSPGPDPTAFRSPHGTVIAALADGALVAFGGVTRLVPGVAYIKRMWVDPGMRGLGLGRRILASLEDQARSLGCDRIRLETNAALTEAMAMYRSCGYEEVAAFNDEPHAHHWFEKTLAASRG